MKAKPLLFPNANASEVQVSIDDDFIAVFDRFLELFFMGSGYVPEPITKALANPTETNKTVIRMWYTVHIMQAQRRVLAKKTKCELSNVMQ